MSFRVVALASLLALSAPLMAETVYTYTGNRFTEGNLLTDSISGQFTVSSPLADSATSYFIPSSFAFSDGVQTITNADTVGSETFEVNTDAVGNISMWYIFINDASVNLFTTSGFSSGQADEASLNDHSGDSGSVFNDPGTWTVTTPVSAAPEPSGLMLLATGITGVAAFGRHRVRTA